MFARVSLCLFLGLAGASAFAQVGTLSGVSRDRSDQWSDFVIHAKVIETATQLRLTNLLLKYESSYSGAEYEYYYVPVSTDDGYFTHDYICRSFGGKGVMSFSKGEVLNRQVLVANSNHSYVSQVEFEWSEGKSSVQITEIICSK